MFYILPVDGVYHTSAIIKLNNILKLICSLSNMKFLASYLSYWIKEELAMETSEENRVQFRDRVSYYRRKLIYFEENNGSENIGSHWIKKACTDAAASTSENYWNWWSLKFSENKRATVFTNIISNLCFCVDNDMQCNNVSLKRIGVHSLFNP